MLCGEGQGPTSESLRKKRAGNEVTGQQQPFSYYNVSMAAGREQQHITALCSIRMTSDSTHTYIQTHLHTDDNRNTTHTIGHLSTYIYRHGPPICNKYGMYNLLD